MSRLPTKKPAGDGTKTTRVRSKPAAPVATDEVPLTDAPVDAVVAVPDKPDDLGGIPSRPEAEIEAEISGKTVVEPAPDAPRPTYRGGEILVARHFGGAEDEASEPLAVRQFLSTPAMVTVQYGTTINLGDYESAKVSVSVTLPAYVEELPAAYDAAKVFAESRMSDEVASIRSARDGVVPSTPAAGAKATPVAEARSEESTFSFDDLPVVD